MITFKEYLEESVPTKSTKKNFKEFDRLKIYQTSTITKYFFTASITSNVPTNAGGIIPA